jgi:ankyrin repeat protein
VNMAFLLLSAGAPVDTIDHSGDSPLHWCIKNNAEIDTSDLQRLLLRMGADCALRLGLELEIVLVLELVLDLGLELGLC